LVCFLFQRMDEELEEHPSKIILKIFLEYFLLK